MKKFVTLLFSSFFIGVGINLFISSHSSNKWRDIWNKFVNQICVGNPGWTYHDYDQYSHIPSISSIR